MIQARSYYTTPHVFIVAVVVVNIVEALYDLFMYAYCFALVAQTLTPAPDIRKYTSFFYHDIKLGSDPCASLSLYSKIDEVLIVASHLVR